MIHSGFYWLKVTNIPSILYFNVNTNKQVYLSANKKWSDVIGCHDMEYLTYIHDISDLEIPRMPIYIIDFLGLDKDPSINFVSLSRKKINPRLKFLE